MKLAEYRRFLHIVATTKGCSRIMRLDDDDDDDDVNYSQILCLKP